MSGGLPYFDAIVLAGGRSSRLGGVPKAGLILEGTTLLQRTCSALEEARHLTVVGPEPDGVGWSEQGRAWSSVREDPPFAGPAAALVAGFRAHPDAEKPDAEEPATGNAVRGEWTNDAAGSRAPWCMVVACDMPRIADLLAVLLPEAARDGGSSLVALDDGREQPLAALYRSADLHDAIAAVLSVGTADNLSIRSLLATVRTRPVPVPPGTTRDVDTWTDARELGVDVP